MNNNLKQNIANSASLETFSIGDKLSFGFSISELDMKKFTELSGDLSRIHFDDKFAKTNGFKEPLVYGALTVAQLSYFVGMLLPGDLGLATSWKIDFHQPLYVNEEAIFEGSISHISEATRSVKIRFEVRANSKFKCSCVSGSKVIASGHAMAKLLNNE